MIKRIDLDDELYPVEAFFNCLDHNQFLIAIENFSNGKGYNPEDMTCFFPSDIAEDEGNDINSYKYIEFWEYSESKEVRLSFAAFINFLRMASISEIEKNPHLSNKIKHLISKTESYLSNL